jgi:ABC-type multidrug transport system fused ATPase/permease subunit
MAQELPERSVVQNLANAPPPDECWAPFGSMLSCVEPLFGLDGSSVGAAVLLGVLTFIGALLIAFGRWIWRSISRAITERRLRKNTFVDFLRSAQFIHETLKQQVSERAISSLKEVVRSVEGNNFRLFGVNNADNDPIERMKKYRSYFNSKDTYIIDTYIYLFELFGAYYNKLCSDSFSHLSKERKEKAIDAFKSIGQNLISASEDLLKIDVFKRQDDTMRHDDEINDKSFARQIEKLAEDPS